MTNTFFLGKGMSIHRSKKVYVSASGFIKIIFNNEQKIKTTRFYPPKIGTKSLGKFYVEFK